MTNEGDYTKVAQYMIDNVQGRPSGENKWSSCRGMLKPVITEPVSAYLRQTLPEKVKIRGGQIVLPKRRRRKSA